MIWEEWGKGWACLRFDPEISSEDAPSTRTDVLPRLVRLSWVVYFPDPTAILFLILCWLHFEHSSISQCLETLLQPFQEGEAGGRCWGPLSRVGWGCCEHRSCQDNVVAVTGLLCSAAVLMTLWACRRSSAAVNGGEPLFWGRTWLRRKLQK